MTVMYILLCPVPSMLLFDQASHACSHRQGENTAQLHNACIGTPVNSTEVVAAVVVVAYNRLDYLQQCITSLLETHGQDQTNRWAAHPAGPALAAIQALSLLYSSRAVGRQQLQWNIIVKTRLHLWANTHTACLWQEQMYLKTAHYCQLPWPCIVVHTSEHLCLCNAISRTHLHSLH